MNSPSLNPKVKIQKNFFYYFNILLIAYPMFYPASALFGHIGQYTLFAVWFVFAVFSKRKFLGSVIKYSIPYILFMLILVTRLLWNTSELEPGFYSPLRLLSQFSLIYVYYVFSIWHHMYSNKKMKRNLINAFFFSFMVSTLISLYYLLDNEHAIRRSFNYSNFAVGDYNLVYTAVAISVLLWISYINKGTPPIKIILMWIISTVLVLWANYMTAILMMILMYLASILIKHRKKRLVILSILTIFILLSPYLYQLILDLLNSVLNLDGISSVIKTRLTDIFNVIVGNQELDNTYSLGSRSYLTQLSWETFKENPVLGVPYADHNSLTIGNHTQWFDNFARFGIVGMVLLILQISIWIKLTQNQSETKLEKTASHIAWLYYIVLGFFTNNMMPGIFIIMFFVSPNFNVTFKNGNNEMNLN